MRAPTLAACLLFAAGVQPAGAQPCHKDRVSTAPGAYVFTQTGQAFQVFPGQEGIVETWLPLDRLLVCRLGGNADELTNMDHRGAKVEALYEAP